MTIISCSYKTDVPAHYGQWFLNRLAAGKAKYTNPYNGQICEVSLRPGDMTGIVFWTRDPLPLLRLGGFDKVRELKIPFYIQLSHLNYSRKIEPGTPNLEKTMKTVSEIADRYGPKVIIWRYDPIVYTDESGESWHKENFEMLAERFRTFTDEVTISFVNLYAKSKRKMNEAGLLFEELQPDEIRQREMTAWMAEVADRKGMALSVCSQNHAVAGLAQPASCVDTDRLSEIVGQRVYAPLKGNRPDCLCARSKDIGAYDSCFSHGCVYCYAVTAPSYAIEKRNRHDPEAEFLVVPEGYKPEPVAPAEDILQMTLNLISG
jgi:DNA repair photolyase